MWVQSGILNVRKSGFSVNKVAVTEQIQTTGEHPLSKCGVSLPSGFPGYEK